MESRVEAYIVVHTSTIEGLHGALGCAGVIEFNKAVVKALRVELERVSLAGMISVKGFPKEGISRRGTKRHSHDVAKTSAWGEG